MRHALRLAAESATSGGGPFGALVLGVRPDKVRVLAPGEAAPAATLAAEGRLVEDLGDRVDVRLTLAGGAAWVARRPAGERAREGAALVALDLGAAHLFEPGERGARR